MKKVLGILLVAAMLLTMTSSLADETMTISWLGNYPPLEDGTWGENRFEEVFGVDVVIKRAETDDEKTVMFSSGDIPDLMSCGSSISVVAGYVDQGIVRSIPLEMIKENMPRYYAMCTEFDPDFFNYGLVNGEIYALPLWDCTACAMGAAINANWLKALNLSVPKTIDELSNVFHEFTYGDPDGNGIDDTYALTAGGATASKLYRNYFPSIFAIYGVNPFSWSVDADGNLVFGFVSDGAKKALTHLAQWYADGLIDPEFITTECRSSGIDVSQKFASGFVGYMDNVSYDDYEWDNDGHVNAKWCSNHAEWDTFFESVTDTKVLYQYDVTTDFNPALEAVGPYYIIPEPIADEDGVAGGYYSLSAVQNYFAFGALCDDAKLAKILSILERNAMEEEVYVDHFGPCGNQWMYAEDGKTRIYNPNFTEMEVYHPQGQIVGNGWCLWPMYNCNPDLLTVISGDRYVQRYDRHLPMFRNFKTFTNTLNTSLLSEVEYPELTTTFVTTNLVKIVRGEISMDDWDKLVAEWYADGGQELTDEANAWYATVK